MQLTHNSIHKILVGGLALSLCAIASSAQAAKTVKLTKLYCAETTEGGEDEIYLTIDVDGQSHRLPSTSFKRMNEDSGLDTWPLNAVYTVEDKMIVTVREEDDSSEDDTIGVAIILAKGGKVDVGFVPIDLPATENGTHSTSWNDGAEYTLHYEVSDAAENLETGFTMAVMSDPQYDFCESDYCKKNAGNSAQANEWHSASIEKLKAASSNFMGVIVNGDLTNTMEDEQLDNYRENYANKFVTYPGLGNHDYENYTPARDDSKNCSDVGILVAKHYCAKEMVDYIVEVARSNPAIKDFDYTEGKWSREGSLAYYFDIGDYRFIQLQNHPAFENAWSVFMSNRSGHEDYKITQSFDWLRAVLAKSKDKNVILNMHALHTGDGLNDSVSSASLKPENRTKYEEGYETLQSIVGEHPNVVGIFAGHIHEWVGNYIFGDFQGFLGRTEAVTLKSHYTNRPDEFTSTGTHVRTIPVLFGGGAMYNKYLKVTFDPEQMTASVIDSRNGNNTELLTDKVYETLLGFKKTENAGIPGHNISSVAGLSVFACAKRCLDNSACKSFDYRGSDETCYFSDKTKADVELKEDYPGDPYDYYERP